MVNLNIDIFWNFFKLTYTQTWPINTQEEGTIV